ncbi:hypothetical protein C5167_032808 [Papaver somniferum]|uniref:Uncharacterized protein n=1 Tax=Papaver somniferum TaxID=3469 RepID=A0A4Y7KBY8_PAPSO|nr:hypothetical protein C5167_032808 [Papaver somniferum]
MASQLGVLMSKTSWAFQPNILRLSQYISISCDYQGNETEETKESSDREGKQAASNQCLTTMNAAAGSLSVAEWK